MNTPLTNTIKSDNKKKTWVKPEIIFVDHGYINTGIHPGGIEANYLPGGSAPSPGNAAYFAS